MSWKEHRARKDADRRHKQLLLAARHVVSRGTLDRRIEDIDLAEVVAIAFGRYQLRITNEEALDYLNAVLAERGYPLRCAHPTPSGATAIPAQRASQDGDEA